MIMVCLFIQCITKMKKMIDQDEYELHFSGHETFPLRQMWLKKVCEQVGIDGSLKKSVFTDDEAITRFGVGKNMVASMKHWALASGVLEEGKDKSCFSLTELGAKIFADDGWDPYSENAATAWFIHWQLAGERKVSLNNKHRSTTWHILFNTYISSDFDNKDIVEHIKKYLLQRGDKSISESTIKRDVETCVKGYSPNYSSKDIEDAAEPMLAELGIIKSAESGKLCFRRGPKSSLPDGVFDYALIMYWSCTAEHESSLSLDDITFGQGSPGRVFKLDEESVAERLFGLSERTSGGLEWTSSSGVRQILKSDKLIGDKLVEVAIRGLERAYHGK